MSQHSVAIYCRLSRDDNKENYESVETQIDICQAYVKENKLGKVYRCYIDDNVSGTTFEREGLNELIKDLENNVIDLIVTKDLSRLGRNNAKTLLFLDFLAERGVGLIAIGDNYDTRKDEDDIIGIKTWYNERYAKDISKKIRSTLKEKMKRGEHLGKAPFGYKKAAGENKLVVDENIRHLIAEVFSLYIGGLGYRKIAEIMQEKKYPFPSQYKNEFTKAKGWEGYHVKRIIENREYCGDTVQGMNERISYKNKKIRKKPKEQWIITEGTHEGIVGRETWELANKIKDERNRGLGRHKNELYLFSGFLVCGKCGSSLVARKVKNKPLTYICSKYMKHGTKERGCSSHSIRNDYLSEILTTYLYELARGLKDNVVNRVNKKFEKENTISNNINELNKKIGQNKKKVDILYNDRLEGNISVELFKERSNELYNQIKVWEAEMDHLHNQAKYVNDYANNLEKISFVFDEAFKTGDILSRESLQRIIDKIYIFWAGEIEEDFCLRNGLNNFQYYEIKKKGGIWINFRFMTTNI